MKNLGVPNVTEDQKKRNPMRDVSQAPPPPPPPQKGKRAKAGAKAQQPIYKKKKISQALREQVWLARFGRVFEHKCYVTWCKNTITVFDFESGHNIPESKGGKTDLTNLYPICRKCNGSMGDRYSIDEWNALHTPIEVQSISVESPSTPVPTNFPIEPKKKKGFCRFFCCFT